jgi:hypothetical protein
LSGRSAAWLARLVRDQEVEGSNPFAPTTLLEKLLLLFWGWLTGNLQGQRLRDNLI